MDFNRKKGMRSFARAKEQVGSSDDGQEAQSKPRPRLIESSPEIRRLAARWSQSLVFGVIEERDDVS